MKLFFRKNLLFLILALLVPVFAGCEQGDSSKDYGFPLIYIPQATVTGLDNSYPIPNGPFGQNTAYTCYYENGKLHIALGVVRAGAISHAKGFTVDLGLSPQQTDRKLTELQEKGTPAIAMPVDLCEIPARIAVESNKNTGTCYMTVDLQRLAAMQSSLYQNGQYKLLVLGLEISNPSHYELAEDNTSVVVILDLNSEHWDNVPENLPESEVRYLFPIL